MPNEYHEALHCLRSGGVLLFWTETGWCLGADARSAEAIAKLDALALPTAPDAHTLLIADVGQLSQYVARVPDVAWDWVEFSEKPLTIVYPQGKNVATAALTAGGGIAIRLLRDDFARNLVHRFGRGVLSTSVAPDAVVTLKTAVGAILQPNPQPRLQLPGPVVRLGLDGEIEFLRK
mgnify:CR=1 FL=1